MDLLDLLRRPEGKTLEFKRDLSSPERVIRTVVAFANTAGGVLLLGVEDRTKRVQGIEDPLAVEERLASLIADRVAPRVVPDIEVVPWRRTHLLAVRVPPSPVRPHFLRGLGLEGGVYVRVGSTNRQADAPLVGELQRYALNQSFDEQPAPDLEPEAVDSRAFARAFDGVRRVRRSHLETLGLLVRYQGRLVPTNGGILLFGKDRPARFPDAWIQVGRFGGRDRTTIQDSVEIRGPLPAGIEEALGFVRRSTAREFVIAGARRSERWTYPLVAVRETVINAVVHADYAQTGSPIRVAVFADRLEVDNPGLLPFGLTVEDVQRGISKLRNRVIGRVFHELGLIERWGSGIQRMQAACRQAGQRPPTLEEVGTHFRVTLWAGRGAPVLGEVDRAILAALRGSQGLSTAKLAARIGLSSRATRSRAQDLVGRGLAVELGTGPNDPRRRYFVAQA